MGRSTSPGTARHKDVYALQVMSMGEVGATSGGQHNDALLRVKPRVSRDYGSPTPFPVSFSFAVPQGNTHTLSSTLDR